MAPLALKLVFHTHQQSGWSVVHSPSVSIQHLPISSNVESLQLWPEISNLEEGPSLSTSAFWRRSMRQSLCIVLKGNVLRKFHSVIPTRKWPWSLCHGSWNTRPSRSKPVQSQFHSVIPARDTKWPWSLCHGSWNTRPSRSKPVQSQCVQTSQVQKDNVRLAVSSYI